MLIKGPWKARVTIPQRREVIVMADDRTYAEAMDENRRRDDMRVLNERIDMLYDAMLAPYIEEGKRIVRELGL